MPSFDYPSNSVLVDQAGMPSTPWQQVFSRWHSLILSVQDSGTTAQRPKKGLFIGRGYFDTTLGYMVNVKFASANPAATVWVNGAGLAV